MRIGKSDFTQRMPETELGISRKCANKTYRTTFFFKNIFQYLTTEHLPQIFSEPLNEMSQCQ